MTKQTTDPEQTAIDKALDILITADGKGKERKARVLMELCECVNANKIRETIIRMHDEGKLY